MKRKMFRVLCWALPLCLLCPASACAAGAARLELTAQIEPLPEFLLPGATQTLRGAMADYLSALQVDMVYCADAQRGLLIEGTLWHDAETLAALRIVADEETVAFSGDLFPAGWYRIGYAELEALYPGPARWATPLRELAKQARRGDAGEAEVERAQREALWAGLLEKAGEWRLEHPQALQEVDSVINPLDQKIAARRYELDLRGRDVVDLNNRVFDTVMGSEWVRRMLRPLTLEALPGAGIGEDGLERIELEIMRELKRQLAMELSGMHRPLYGKVWVDTDGRITDADLTSEPAREGELTLWTRYEWSGLMQWIGQEHWNAYFRASNRKESLDGNLKFWGASALFVPPVADAQRKPDGFELTGEVVINGAQEEWTKWEATLRGEQQEGGSAEVVLSARMHRLAEQAAGALTLRIADDSGEELLARFPDMAECVDLGHMPQEQREAFEAESAAARTKRIAGLQEGMPSELFEFFALLVSKI